jgi:DUF917 family protein
MRYDWRDVRNAVVPNSISATIGVGRSVRQARERGEDPVRALIKTCEGYLLFRGKVKSFEREEEAGFMWGNISQAMKVFEKKYSRFGSRTST